MAVRSLPLQRGTSIRGDGVLQLDSGEGEVEQGKRRSQRVAHTSRATWKLP